MEINRYLSMVYKRQVFGVFLSKVLKVLKNKHLNLKNTNIKN